MTPPQHTDDIMIWNLSDGTVIRLGGKVEGSTFLAQELRRALRKDARVPTGPIPSGGKRIDLNNPSHVDWVIHNELDRPCNKWMMVSLVEGPEVEPLYVLHESEGGDGDLLY